MVDFSLDSAEQSESIDSKRYEDKVRALRASEYPLLQGTTPIPKTLIERFSKDLSSSLFGNPHSASPSSQLSTQRIENARYEALRFFHADPQHFDLVFVANATAGIKLVAESFRDLPGGFFFGYHSDAHTSLVGVRELASQGSICFRTDIQLDQWLETNVSRRINGDIQSQLVGWPAQSNMNGRRLPLSWSGRIRDTCGTQNLRRYSLLDASALVSTSPLDLSDHSKAPDFTVLSFYKIFGFPDLGALIVRKEASAPLICRKYFGGGTVDMVLSIKENWHEKKRDHIHSSLEDGTLPVHDIVALGHAIHVHRELYGSMTDVSRHTSFLINRLYNGMQSLRHSNGRSLCSIYSEYPGSNGHPNIQGPIIAFNLRNSQEAWVSNAEVEKLATVQNIHLRAGGLCNPGGIASSLGLEAWEMKQNFSAGHRCGTENDILNGKPTGMLRISLGAMSLTEDVDAFVEFLRCYFVDSTPVEDSPALLHIEHILPNSFYVESLMIYPIKSCSPWKIGDKSWPVRPEGLAWDREWCLVHEGTDKALTQKTYPQMTLIRPSIDLENGLLRIRLSGSPLNAPEITVPLSADPTVYGVGGRHRISNICDDQVQMKVYSSDEITGFFTSAIGVPCQLARLPSSCTTRHSKAQLQQHQLLTTDQSLTKAPRAARPILLSNESPILMISRSSLSRLNEQIKARGGRAVEAEAFRPNIVVAQSITATTGSEQPYVEDFWRFLRIGSQRFELLGSCRRCQMVCINQETAERRREPFSTLAKTRRFDGKVWFGQHACHVGSARMNGVSPDTDAQNPTIRVGDMVVPYLTAAEMNGGNSGGDH